jgi:hypothetical protein
MRAFRMALKRSILATFGLATAVPTLERTQSADCPLASSITSHLFSGGRVEAKQLCVQKSDGSDVCITGDQLTALLEK